MAELTRHWAFDPLAVVVAAVVLLHEVGLARLARRSVPARVRRRRLRSLPFYGGLALLVIAVESPIGYWSNRYFYVHMIEHVLVMFLASLLVVAGAPWIGLMFGVPVGVRRRIGRALTFGDVTAPARAVWRFVTRPWVSLVAFNAAMIVWHLPVPLDLAVRNEAVHVWCMDLSFFATGLLFWLQIIPSRPFHRRAGTAWQIAAIVSTNLVMFVLAMALSIFSQHSWYPAYRHVPGVTLSPFADQQIGAAVLWVCGDFWAVPALIVVVRRAIGDDESLSSLLDSLVRAREGPPPVAPGTWGGETAPTWRPPPG